MKVYCEHYKTCNYDKVNNSITHPKCRLISGADVENILIWYDGYSIKKDESFCFFVKGKVKLKTEFEVLVEKTIKQGELIEKDNT